jgi:hypothetical protein
MDETKQWSITVLIDEHDGKTRAKARLHSRDAELTGVGFARCNPADRDVPEIGDELAVARALADLSHRLLDVTVDDIEQITHRPAVLPR